MKNLLLIFLFIAASSVNALAEEPIPEIVKKSFAQLYPEVESPFWENRHDGIVAIFQDTEGWKKAFFQNNGHWMETRIRLTNNQLPAGVKQFIQDHYREADITFLGKVYTKDAEWYRVESEFPDKVVLKNIDEHGNLIKEESIILNSFQGFVPTVVSLPALPVPKKIIRPDETP